MFEHRETIDPGGPPAELLDPGGQESTHDDPGKEEGHTKEEPRIATTFRGPLQVTLTGNGYQHQGTLVGDVKQGENLSVKYQQPTGGYNYFTTTAVVDWKDGGSGRLLVETEGGTPFNLAKANRADASINERTDATRASVGAWGVAA